MPGSHSAKHEEMPLFPRTLSVLESGTPLKEMGLNRGVGFSFSFYSTKLGFFASAQTCIFEIKVVLNSFCQKRWGQLLFSLSYYSRLMELPGEVGGQTREEAFPGSEPSKNGISYNLSLTYLSYNH